MDETQLKKQIVEACKDISKHKVMILIGKASKLFKSIYKGDYSTITTADDVRQFMEKFQGVPNDKPLVFEDLSLMTPEVQTRLLKFIEEPSSPLIILASMDNISPIILSRCKVVFKVPIPTECNPIPVSKFIERKQEVYAEAEKNGVAPDFDVIAEASKSCPEYLMYMAKLSKSNYKNMKVIDKYIKLIDIS